MFLAGDRIGIALKFIQGMVVSVWNYLKNRGVLKIVLGMIKAYIGVQKMIFTLPLTLMKSLWAAAKSTLTLDFGGIVDSFCKPWIEWKRNFDDIFAGKPPKPWSADEILNYDPMSKVETTANEASASVRKLRMVGMNGQRTLMKMDGIAAVQGAANGTQMLKRIQGMERLYAINSKQVVDYQKFLSELWAMAGQNADNAQNALSEILQSPELSQKILSVFFYYNPQTQETMMLRPSNHIGRFVANLQEMMSTEGNWKRKFRMFVDALDQMNKERAHIVNGQGDAIVSFANRIANFNLNGRRAQQRLESMVAEFNKGDLFKGRVNVGSSFDQMRRGNAKTQNVVGVTGRKLGSSNQLLATTPPPPPGGVGPSVSDFKAKKPEQGPGTQMGRVQVPASMSMSPTPPPVDSGGSSVKDRWLAHMNKRQELLAKNVASSTVDKMGYESMTLDEFREREVNLNPELKRKQREEQERALAGFRLAGSIQRFNEQGRVLTARDTVLGMKFNPSG